MITVLNEQLNNQAVEAYFASLVGKVFKILPLAEHKEVTLSVYVESLLFELIGLQAFLPGLSGESLFVAVLANLQSLALHHDDVDIVRREVFKTINLCKALGQDCEVKCHEFCGICRPCPKPWFDQTGNHDSSD